MTMFFARRNSDGNRVLIRKDAVRFVEPVTASRIRLYVDGIGDIVTDTYDFDGFASVVMDVDADDSARSGCQKADPPPTMWLK